MDVTQKRERVKAEIDKVHPLEKDAAGGSGHLSYSRLGDVVVGETAKDGSFEFAAEVSRESEFGGSTHWFHGTIAPEGRSRIDTLPPVTWSDDSGVDVRRNRATLGLPVLGESGCHEIVRDALQKHLKAKPPFAVKMRTGAERVKGDTVTFDFAVLRWDGAEHAAAMWYVGTVKASVRTGTGKAEEIREHPKSKSLMRHPNFNVKDLEAGEEAIWSELGFPRPPERPDKSSFDANGFLKGIYGES